MQTKNIPTLQLLLILLQFFVLFSRHRSKTRSDRHSPAMVSHVTLTILFSYAAVFWCLDALSVAAKIQTPRSAFVPRLAAGALLPAVLTTFGLTSLLLFAHVRALGGANAATGAAAAARRRRFLDCLANAALAATAAALLAGAVLWLGTDGDLGGAWLSTE